MHKISLQGIFPPLPTSFDEHENLFPEKIRENIKKLSGYNLSGFLILGSNGEQVMLTDKERAEAIAAAKEAIPEGKLLLAGTGGQSTRETINLTRDAAREGADAVLVLNPFYYKNQLTHDALVKHYCSVADASPVPVVVYNMPGNTGVDMTAATITELSKHPNIIGLKESGGNVVKIGEVLRNSREGFQVVAGGAGFLLPALSVGAVGGILALANIAPGICLDLFSAFTNNPQEAKKIQQKIIPLNSAVTASWGVPALKHAMDRLGIYGGPVRGPLLPLKDDIKEKLNKLLDEIVTTI